ncbi:MAG: NYN domain-containing protein [Actinomycetota bacterium]|nr:NYN domain-containing protein [Actinomycetota bacterium]
MPDHLLRSAAEAALAVARRRQGDDPPVPAPKGLVPFLAFARLPDRALIGLRRVLDDDDDLRRATSEATSEQAVGRASWLFLDRPVGWEDELDRLVEAADEIAGEARDQRVEADLVRRLQAEETARHRGMQEAAELRRQVADVKDQLASERRGRRRAESDSGRLRQQVSDLRDEVDERRRAEADLLIALDAARSRAEITTASQDVSDAPAGPEAAEAKSANEQTIDRHSLAAAVARSQAAGEALTDVLAELRRLVAEDVVAEDGHAPRPPLRTTAGPARPGSAPCAPRRRPVSLPPGTFDDSVAAAEHLVRIGEVLVLVDGYNVTKLARPDLALPQQRSWLVDAALELAARTGARLELVFDGADERASAPADLGRRTGVQVRFSSAGTEADDLLLDRVAQVLPARPLVVASDDRRVRDGARRLGANVITSPQLLAVLGRPL